MTSTTRRALIEDMVEEDVPVPDQVVVAYTTLALGYYREDDAEHAECCCSNVFPCEWATDPGKPCTCCESCVAASGGQCAAVSVDDILVMQHAVS